MNGTVYREYLTHPSIPHEVDISLSGSRMILNNHAGFRHEFPTRRACALWLKKHYPDALLYAFNEGVTLCAGTVANLRT